MVKSSVLVLPNRDVLIFTYLSSLFTAIAAPPPLSFPAFSHVLFSSLSDVSLEEKHLLIRKDTMFLFQH